MQDASFLIPHSGDTAGTFCYILNLESGLESTVKGRR